MSETSIQTRPSPAPVVAPEAPRRFADRFRFLYKILKAAASLRLTVFLFALSMILVFCGTLAMMDQGLFSVLSRYFRSGIAWIPLQVFVRFGQVFFGLPPNTQIAGSFPFPGGWTIGAVLLVNLLAAHIVRFRLSWKRAGILMLHSGLIVLMLGELVTGLFSVENSMLIPLGGAANYLQSYELFELAFVWPNDAKNDNVTVIPDSLLQKGGLIQNDDLPVDVEVVRYLYNSALTDAPSRKENLATRGFGLDTGAVEQPPGRGVDVQTKHDTPSAYITLKDKKSGESLGTYLVSFELKSQDIDIGGTTYQLALRQRRSYRPYTFHLEDLKHENYRGTQMAKRYASLVRITDPEHAVDREVLIHMNHPLYYEGESFYQSEVKSLGDVEYTGLQVVRNPGWPLPYIACTMVIVGMVIHFLLHLMSFLRRVVTQ
ncbi:MAG: cytochrome c biogenesis protein ResB [Gemmataceae bacterium]